MPVIECPNCNKKVRVADNSAGKRARCPLCEQPFTVPGGEDAVSDNEPPKRRSRSEDEDRPRRNPSRSDEEDRRLNRDEDDRPRRRDRDDEEDRPRRRSRDEEGDRPRRSRSRRDSFADLNDDGDYDRPHRSRRSPDWKWGWNPLIGITYGPVPIGLIVGGIIGIIVLCAAALGGR